jgi:hypothetical protein
VDTELDHISSEHSRGRPVPIAKGGDKVRSRIALPDGSAAMIKYDVHLYMCVFMYVPTDKNKCVVSSEFFYKHFLDCHFFIEISIFYLILKV